MIETKRKFISRTLVPVLALALALSGCAAKNPATINPQTPAQRMLVYNGVLAESNHALASGVIVLQKSGVLSVTQTSQILGYSERVANASNAVAVIQQAPGDWAKVGPQIKAILNAISPPGDFMAWLGAAPGSPAQASLNGILSVVQLMLAEASK